MSNTQMDAIRPASVADDSVHNRHGLCHSAAAFLLATLVSCSLAMPDPRANYNPVTKPHCSASNPSPLVDATIAALAAVAFLSVAIGDDDDPPDDFLKPLQDVVTGFFMVVTGLVGVTVAASAATGFSKLSRCDRQWQLHERCRAQGGTNCVNTLLAPPPIAPQAPIQNAPEAPAQSEPAQSPDCLEHRRAIRMTKDPKDRVRRIKETPIECLR